jgi:hypothetical protein
MKWTRRLPFWLMVVCATLALYLIIWLLLELIGYLETWPT